MKLENRCILKGISVVSFAIQGVNSWNAAFSYWCWSTDISDSFSSILHSCQRSNNTVFETYCPKPIHVPDFQLSKRRSSELYWEQAASVPTPLNANELCLSAPALPATYPSHGENAAYTSGSMCLCLQ